MPKKALYFEVLCWILTLAAILFLAGPVAWLVCSIKGDFFLNDLFSADIWYSLFTTIIAGFASSILGLLTGVPLAFILSQSTRKTRNLIEPLIEIPIILPPIIAGVALVSFLSQQSFVGSLFASLGIRFISSVNGIIAGMFFVGVPFIVKTSLAAFLELDKRLIMTARTLGADSFQVFRTIMLPYAARHIMTGYILMLGRSLGIFGTVVLISYHPRTVPVLTYFRFLSYGPEAAKTPALLLIVISLVFFVIRRIVTSDRRRG